MAKSVNLLNFTCQKLENYFQEIGEKTFRARQVFKWLHQNSCSDFALMTNLSKDLRRQLNFIACVELPQVVTTQKSADGTYKWLLKLNCGNSVETVFIPEQKRGTLCVSSQVGCALNCSFCSTGKQGFNRNLSVAEIIGQVWIAKKTLDADNHPTGVTNVVMMGMGEPLLNFEAVVDSMQMMMDDNAYGLSKRRVTLSTSGIIPEMLRLKEFSDVSLAVSLHAPNNQLRDELVPINKKYPLQQLMQVCREYFPKDSRRVVTFEYVMLHEVNDTKSHAQELLELLQDIPCKVNLIPFNPFPMTQYKRSSNNSIHAFKDILTANGINTITRKTRGDDIGAACGQLAGNVVFDRTSRSAKWKKEVADRQV